MLLVSPRSRQIYSAMLPGLVAGHYVREEVEFDVAALCRRAQVDFLAADVVALDPAARVATLRDGRQLDFDVASVNAGSGIALPGFPVLAVKPFEEFVERLPGAGHVAICGGGAAGVELAMALRHRGGGEVTVFSDQPSFTPALETRVVRALRRRGVDYRPGMRIDAVQAGPLVISGSARQQFDHVLWATGAAALPWLRGSGLATDHAGFVQVDEMLRSVSHAHVFAVGDCAATGETKSGVHSVRQGRALEQNLRRLAAGQALLPYQARRRALMLLTCGARYAIAARGGWSAEGRWAWWWKNRIDRRWLRTLSGN